MQKQLMKTLFGRIQHGGLRVRFWDNEEVDYGDTAPKVSLDFKSSPNFAFYANDPTMALGEAYMDGALDYKGKLEDILLLLSDNSQYFATENKAAKAIKNIANLASRVQAKNNIQHHYDLGNDFFALWLDETMSYSCGYFKHPDDALNQAQLQKIEHILKKLHLQPDETLLDIGCGWGWLIIKAAQLYNVKAMGITLSEEQCKGARQRIADSGLTGQVNVELMNYLDLDPETYSFDKVVSVGMFEHVGKSNIPQYFSKVNELLKPGGLSLLHTITDTAEDKPENAWIKKYIFPGGYVPALQEVIGQLPNHDFHLLHAESLRMHYAMTLDHWYLNFSKQIELIREKFDDRFIRMWELYLTGCAAAFRVTGLDIYQFLFVKGLNNQLPLTYDHVYIS